MHTSRTLKITHKGETHTLTLTTLPNGRYIARHGDRTIEADVIPLGGGTYSVITSSLGNQFLIDLDRKENTQHVRIKGKTLSLRIEDPREMNAAGGNTKKDGPLIISTSMPGRIVRVLVKEGDEVEEGQGVIVIEAMKMQNELKASRAGKVVAVPVKEGQAVETAEILMRIE